MLLINSNSSNILRALAGHRSTHSQRSSPAALVAWRMEPLRMQKKILFYDSTRCARRAGT